MSRIKSAYSLALLFRRPRRYFMSRTGSWNRRGNFRRLEAVKLEDILFEIGVALIRILVLIIGGPVRVAAVKIFYHVHAGCYLTEGSKALAAVIKSAVAAQVDKDLGRARVRAPGLSERNRALGVGLRHGIVLDVRVLPRFVDRGTAG